MRGADALATVVLAGIASACAQPAEGTWQTVDQPLACPAGTAGALRLDISLCETITDDYIDTSDFIECLGGGELCGCTFRFGRGDLARSRLTINVHDGSVLPRLGDCGFELWTQGGVPRDDGDLLMGCEVHGDVMGCRRYTELGCRHNDALLPCSTEYLTFERLRPD